MTDPRPSRGARPPRSRVELADLVARIGLAKLARQGVVVVTIAHDDWCSLLKGADCDCDPDLRFEAQP